MFLYNKKINETQYPDIKEATKTELKFGRKEDFAHEFEEYKHFTMHYILDYSKNSEYFFPGIWLVQGI